ncbi:MAG: segregation/condensation protein A [Phycisphaeraceae bacterium]|nr:segregation/condensation protein A [Phycisphaerae bacterium]MBX3391559.1 segregation/condensation protein A [Phycisphaeraceae bacterium]
MITDDYRVTIEQFEGPLDLLLFLIRRDEVEITDIPVGRIAEQYMEFLSRIDRIDIDAAGEFLVMAATLMEIKSRMLGPATAQASGDGSPPPREADEDPRAVLVRQLLEYKRFRDAASELDRRLGEWSGRFPAGSSASEDDSAAVEEGPEADEAVDLGDVGLFDLVGAFQRIMEAVNFDRLGSHQVQYDETPIELHAADIVDRLMRETTQGQADEVELSVVLAGRTRSEMIGLFLAVLDLVRTSRVRVRQERADGRVLLALARDGQEGFSPPSTPPAPDGLD